MEADTPNQTAPRGKLTAAFIAALVVASASVAAGYDLHFDYTSFETGFGQSQFNVLNYPSINGNYMMTSKDNHRPEMVANGNALAQFYNNFNADYNYPTAQRRTPAQEAAHIDAYTRTNSTNNGARPEWLILNEISASQWQLNPGAPSLSEHRTWVIDTVTLLNDVYGYKVVTYSPYETVGTANAASWRALAAKSYIAIESYQSGTEVWNSGSTNAARLAWVQGKYQASKNTYLATGVPQSRLFISEHFANNEATFVDGQGNTLTTGWGRAGLASAAAWDQVIMLRQDAMLNVGFAGFLAYNWGGNAMGITQAEQIQHEYYYRSRRVLPSQKPQWLSDGPLNVNGTTIPLSWNQPLNWLGGVPNAVGAEANFWRTLNTNRTITLDGAKTVGKLSFDSPFSYTLIPGSGGGLAFSAAGGPAMLASSQGSHFIGVGVQLNTDLTAVISAGTLTINGSLTGSGRLTKTGTGVLALNGSNSHSGLTSVIQGILRGTMTSPGGVISVGAGGTLEAENSIQRALVNNGVVKGPTTAGQQLLLTGRVTGVGAYAGNISFGGDFAPGASPAAVTLGSAVFLSDNSLEMEIGGTAKGLQFDHLNATGSLAFGGELVVSLINGFQPVAGDSFDLFDWSSATGTFDTIKLPELSELAWDESRLYTDGTLSIVATGDFNADGAVDGMDLARWSNNFGLAETASHAQGDADGDGDVDSADLLVWQRQLGGAKIIAKSGGVLAPEATSLTLSLMFTTAAAFRRRPAGGAAGF